MSEDTAQLTLQQPERIETTEPTGVIVEEANVIRRSTDSDTHPNKEESTNMNHNDGEDAKERSGDEEWHSYSLKFDYYHDVNENESEESSAIPNTPLPAAAGDDVEMHKTTEQKERENDFEKEQEVKQILESLKIALTFLLHPQSPLFAPNDHPNSAQDRLHDFQEKCAMFNNNTDYESIGDDAYWEQRVADLHSLYSASYGDNEHRLMDKLWSVWKEKRLEDKKEEEIQMIFFNQTETLRLSECAELFKVSSQQTLYELESNTVKDDIYAGNIDLNANYYELKGIKSSKAMNKWLRANQTLKSDTKALNAEDSIINTNSRPMIEWTWQELVSVIAEIDAIANFSSVLYQYQISGRELTSMDVKQIQYLIECSMINNNGITLNELNDIKLQCKQQKVEWHIIKDAKGIKKKLDKIRIQSHIVAQYYFAIKILKSTDQIFRGSVEHKREAQKIYDLIQLLQVNPHRGPKYFWKMDMVYFSKIDNFLAVLIVDGELRNLFQKCFPDFLVDENSEITRFDVDNTAIHRDTPLQSLRMSYSNRPTLNRRLSMEQADLLCDIEEDYLDKSIDLICVLDKCECCHKVREFVHDLQRLYIKTFCVLLISLLTGCICISIWYWYSSILQINEAMSLSLKVLGDRARNKMVYEYWKPQMFTNTAINALLHSTLLDKSNADPTNANDTSYDYYLQQFTEHNNTDSVWGLWLYNNDTNGMIGAYRLNEKDIMIADYDGSACLNEWYYDASSKTRDVNRKASQINCEYVPRSRPWFHLGAELAMNESSAAWTDPYLFATGGDNNIGISLVTPITDDDGTFMIILAEMVVKTISRSDALENIYSALPVGTRLMVATSSLDVIFSSSDEIDIQSTDVQSNDGLIRETLSYLRGHEHNDHDVTFEIYDATQEYYYSIYPFNTIYIDFFSESPSELILSEDDENIGFVIIANDASYLDPNWFAWDITYVILVVMLVIAFVNVCWQMEYEKKKHSQAPTRGQLIKVNRRKNKMAMQMLYQNSNSTLGLGFGATRNVLHGTLHTPATSGDMSPASSDGGTRDTDLHAAIRKNNNKKKKRLGTFCFVPVIFHCSHGGLLMFTLCQIVFTLLLISVIWEYCDSLTKNVLLDEIIPKQEFNQVADEVYYMFEVSDMVKKTLEQNYEHMINANDAVAMDMMMINLMKSYIRPNSEFTPFMIYYGTPEGRFLGTIRVPNTKQLQHLRRDESTGFDRTFYNVIEGNIADYVDGVIDTQDLYDPRCRPWYVVALDKSFSGTMASAYPNDSFHNFVYDTYPPSLTQNCDEAKAAAMDLYGITADNSNDFYSLNAPLSNYVNNDERGLVWARYVFAELTTIGLTASSTVTNEEGEVLAVIAIDWVLDSLSQLLVSAVGDHEDIHDHEEDHDDDNSTTSIKEYSWIFEANTEEAAMIASSDMVTITDTSKLGGCLTFSGGTDAEQVPLIASEHPAFDIRVNSKEIISIQGIASLPMINSGASSSIVIPLGLPHLECGRIAYYDIDERNATALNTHVAYNVDWAVCRTIDRTKMDVEDMRFTIMLVVSIIFAVGLLLRKLSKQKQLTGREGGEGEDEEEEEEEEEEDIDDNLYKIMRKMKPIIMESANSIWSRSKSNNNYNIMTTDMSKDFCANRANQFIASTEDGYLFLKCVWSYCDPVYGNEKIIFHDIMESSLYSTYILCVVGLHLIFTLFDHTSNAAERGAVVLAIVCCIILEFLDFICVFIKKYIEWDLDGDVLITLYEINFGFKHRFVNFLRRKFHDENNKIKNVNLEPKTLYFMFHGPRSHLLVIHIVLLLLILIDFCIHASNPGIFSFSYYVPILPALLILRNNQIYNFGKDFMYALWKSKHVLLSYLSFIFMISVLTISLFGFMSTENTKINSFYSISEAIVTSFVYMSTAENYELVYNIFEQDFYRNNAALLSYALCFLIIVGLLGTFCFIPVIIHQFEFAFNELELKQAKKFNFQKTNCICAAFIMLDMNNDQGIDNEELKQLISKSILMDKNKVFNVFEKDDADLDGEDAEAEDGSGDGDGDDGIDLVGFVNYLMAQEFRNKIKKTHGSQSKLQALLECNMIRRPQYNNLILITLVIPTYIFSVLKGLNGFSDTLVEYILIALFALNFVEINMRWFSFGAARYFDVKSHPNPNYIVASINNYSATQTNNNQQVESTNNQANTRLSADEIQWANKHLNEIRPLSIDEKSILTLTHRMEFVVIYANLVVFLVCKLLLHDEMAHENESFAISFIQFGILLRTFTLLKSNQILMYSIFTVFPQFISLIIFLFLYIYWWARLGLILFGNNITKIVIEEIYDSAPSIVANFNSSGYGILALIQLLFGEAWHEVMYLNALATSMQFSAYFIIYIAVVTIIVSNIFIGLFLAGIDDLDKAHKVESDLKKLQKCLKSKKLFRKYAAKKLKSIQYQLKQNEMKTKKLNKQMQHINKLLRKVNLQEF